MASLPAVGFGIVSIICGNSGLMSIAAAAVGPLELDATLDISVGLRMLRGISAGLALLGIPPGLDGLCEAQ
jgi:hypothetical protein